MKKKLSARALKLWDRLLAGAFYPTYAENTPKAMQELIDVGLVKSMGRVTQLRACWVPKNSKPGRVEVIQ